MSISKTLFTVTTITLLSRVLSLLSIQVYMAAFGAQNIYINIYSYALIIPNTIFNILGTIISAVVVPIYAGLLTKNKKDSEVFINNIITIICISVLVLIGIGYFLAPMISVGSGFEMYENFVTYALRVMLISMFFYAFHYIFQGVLHSHNIFLLPAISPVFTSIIVMSYIFFLKDYFYINGLIYATVIGLSFQAIILFPKFKKYVKYKISIDFKNKNIKQAFKLSVPVLLSVVSFQINTIFNATLASNVGLVTIMSYVQNLMLVIILSIVYSITNVYLPKLTKLWQEDQKDSFKTKLEDVIIIVLFFLVPASFGMFFLSEQIIELLAAWGNFNRADVNISSAMLSLYAIGIVFIGLKEVLDRAFYAKKNSGIPSIFGFIIMVINITFSLFVWDIFGFLTMPISFVISTSIGVIGLFISINKDVKIINKRFLVNLIKFLIASVVMSVFVITTLYFLIFFVNHNINNEFIHRIINLFVPFLIGIFVYFVCVILLKVERAKDIFLLFMKKIKKGR
ncbi:MAG: murein biosynthesis integral membrane protein MurJ [Defluviitaleaceae bacterium]|nr:murein biosynthesis integral membrane protein MurJ [Defluviitaleaceae bacterium]